MWQIIFLATVPKSFETGWCRSQNDCRIWGVRVLSVPCAIGSLAFWAWPGSKQAQIRLSPLAQFQFCEQMCRYSTYYYSIIRATLHRSLRARDLVNLKSPVGGNCRDGTTRAEGIEEASVKALLGSGMIILPRLLDESIEKSMIMYRLKSFGGHKPLAYTLMGSSKRTSQYFK